MSDPPAQPNAESPVSLSDNLIAEIISFSDVKSLMQMRCVCKSWRSIISDPKFVKLHLKRSARNPYLTLIRDNIGKKLIPFPVRRLILLENPWILLPDNLCYESQDICYPSKDMEFRNAIGFCNGLVLVPFLEPCRTYNVKKVGAFYNVKEVGAYFECRYVYGHQ
ncbi:putative F-box domain-containing protein [Medicago truncatula]|uniref:Putative F-box domain-containing protein n=1 Tax=Medicago truncatula TaxID=3880 RepID=A0A396GPW2_MEDTR|nr:putative F-box domain-containing protein [Medicago truncatula]